MTVGCVCVCVCVCGRKYKPHSAVKFKIISQNEWQNESKRK